MEARLERHGSGYVLIVERQLDHPPQKVWRAVTERDALRSWFPCDVEGTWEPGAELQFTFLRGEGEGLSEEDMRGEVLAVDEPRLLEFRWGREHLRFELAERDGGTFFRLSNRIQDPSCGARDAAGWEGCIENLDLILEGLATAKFETKVWMKRFRHYVEKFEPTFGPQEDAPFDLSRLEGL